MYIRGTLGAGHIQPRAQPENAAIFRLPNWRRDPGHITRFFVPPSDPERPTLMKYVSVINSTEPPLRHRAENGMESATGFTRRIFQRRVGEAAAVLVVYVLFIAVGAYAGQTTVGIEIIGPQNGISLTSSPVELVAGVTVRSAPLSNVNAGFTIRSGTGPEAYFESLTDLQGIARLVFPAQPGNYTWFVTVIKEGYPTITSPHAVFTVKLSLTVVVLLPSIVSIASSPVQFKVRIIDLNGQPVESANVTFYVDSRRVGSNLTDRNGIADLSWSLNPGQHAWFASATKDSEGGISKLSVFVVG